MYTVFSSHEKIAVFIETNNVSPALLAKEFRETSDILLWRLGIIVFLIGN